MPAIALMLSGAVSGGGGLAGFATLTIDHTKCGSADTTDYALAVVGTYTVLKGTGSGGALTSVNNVAFYSDVGKTTLLKFERVFHDLTTGSCEYHIKVPTLTHSTDVVIYPDVDTSNTATDHADPTNVWDSGFKGVYHMGTASSPAYTDSTSNANHGTAVGTGIPFLATTGAFGGGTLGGGVNINDLGAIDLGTSSTLSFTGDATVEAWQKAKALSPSDVNFIYVSGNNAGNIQFGLEWNRTPNKYTSIWGPGFDIKATSASVSTSWQRIVCTRVGSNGASSGIRHYVDGALDASSPQTGSGTPSSFVRALIGSYQYTGGQPPQRNEGKLDEIRVSNVVRSASYETATYNNHSSPSTFYTLA